jgi:HEAT repeat protein
MRAPAAILAVLAIAAMWASAGRGPRPAGPPGGDPELVELLSGIDHVPSRSSLDLVLGPDALEELIAIARGEAVDASDPGLRARAYRALALYPEPETATALRAAVAEHADEEAGIDVIYLRAAVDSLAQVAGPAAVDDLVPLLDHASRDVRAASAIALGDTGSGDAVTPLRARLSVEDVGQVRLAIAEALRVLEGN